MNKFRFGGWLGTIARAVQFYLPIHIVEKVACLAERFQHVSAWTASYAARVSSVEWLIDVPFSRGEHPVPFPVDGSRNGHPTRRFSVHRSPLHAAFVVACAAIPLTPSAFAHGVAGKRVFPTTLTLDDPAVADEASLPTIQYQRHGTGNGGAAFRETDITGEYDKRITEHLGVAINYGYAIQDQIGQSSIYGFQNFETTLKYQFLQNAPHELLMSIGVVKEWGGTGATANGIAETKGSTTPTVYFGKGFGDLSEALEWLQPIAITGTFGYRFQDVPTSTTTVIDPDSGVAILQVSHAPDLLVWGMSIQYSLRYLQANIMDLGLPGFLGRITPLVEFTYTIPATRSNGMLTRGTIAPGFIYSTRSLQFGIEALLPATRGSNAATGFIAQLHFFFDDIFPASLGKPLFGWR